MKFTHHLRKTLLSCCVLSVMYSTYSQAQTLDNETSQLAVIEVTAIEQEQKLAEQVKTAKDLSREMVNDSRDLVRYETGVTVVEAGRFGSSGYAIRGVDENRVAITVDGLHQAETLSSQGFKELFEGYGNFNNTRNSVEIEHLNKATIRKGADSVAVGSGALGGSVSFQTKDARDFLNEKDYYLGHKIGYATANNQLLNSTTLAGRYKGFDALLIATQRDGHETENYGYSTYADNVYGRAREKTDPYDVKQDSILGKLSFSPSDKHRFILTSDNAKQHISGTDFSYTLKSIRDYQLLEEQEIRHTNDNSKRNLWSFSYENNHSNPLWDQAKFSFSQQKISTRARTDDYCDGNEKCNNVANPLGLQVKNNKIVDKNGNDITVIDNNTVEINGKQFVGLTSLNQRLSDTWLSCSLFDCTKPVTAYQTAGYVNGKQTYTPVEVNFNINNIQTDVTGHKFARLELSPSYLNYKTTLLTPTTKGFLENTYSQRDLNTKTRQFDMELSKQFNTFNITHQLNYGALHSQTKKEMINITGFNGRLPQWWAKQYLGVNWNGTPYTCETAPGIDQWNGYLCPKEDTFSFLIPLKATNNSLYLQDNIRFNDRFAIDVGYRYSHIKYKPNYVAGESPKIPDDMVKGLFIPLPEATHGLQPRYWDYAGGWSDPQYQADLAKWKDAEQAYQQAIAENPQQNIDYFAQNKSFSNHSYSFGLTFDPVDFLRVQAKYANGFRIPTGDEIYFTFKHPDFTILPNVDLKPEQAKTKELGLTLHGDKGFISASAFQTDYKNFLHLDFKGQKEFKNAYEQNIPSLKHYLYQNINLDNAKVKGIELNTQFNVGSVFSMFDGLNVNYKLTHQRGRMAGDIPMNAIQPRTSVFGIGYDHPSERFGANFYATHVTKKKATDTYNMYHEADGSSDTFSKWRSDSYSVLDLTAYVRPIKNLTIQAGVYNLTNRKYMTWDSARSIKPFGTSNRVDSDGTGLNRFTAPERNYKFTMEYHF